MSEDLPAYLNGESSDSGPACFWSYVREDNTRTAGKLLEVAEDLAHSYEFETGNALPVFRDVANIAWGERWADRVAHGLQNVMFLIPAVTPNFLKSEACRSEVTRFQSVCRARGVDGLILPVIFSGSHLITEDSDDEIAQLIARTQYVAFDEVWPMERNSERWIAAIREMAKSIIRIEKSAEEQLSRALTAEALTPSRTSPGNANTPSRQPIDIEALENEDGDDDPQIIELTEQLDQGFRSLATKITSATEHFTDVADRVGMWGDLQRPKNPKAVNQYFFNIAHEIDAPSRQFHRAAAEAYNEAIAVDTAIRQMRQLTHSMTDSTARDTFNGVLRNGFLSSSSGTMNTIDQLEKLAPMIADAERLSALLKKSLRPTRSGIQIIKDVGGMMLDWGRLADLEDNDEREPIAIPSAS